MSFRELLKLYNIDIKKLEEIRKLKDSLSEEDKKEIAEATKEFVFEKLPHAAKLLEEIGAERAFSGTIENLLAELLNFSNKTLIYIETVIKTHCSGINIPIQDFLKDYFVFSKNLIEKIKLKEEFHEAFKQLVTLLMLIYLYTVISYVRVQKEQKDPITKLSSKQQIIYRTKEIIAGSKTILLLDIDDFSEYNLYYGYSVGNTILSTFASAIQLLFPESYITRLQNDEFLIVTPKPIGDARRELIKLQRDFEENPLHIPTRLGVEELRIGFTAVLFNARVGENLNFDDVMWVLYNALFKLSKSQPGKIHIIPSNVVKQSLKDKELIYKLICAFNHKNLKLAVQKVVNIFSGSTLFSETLARIVLPDGKLLSPGSFMHLIENSTLERKLDKIIVEKVFKLMNKGKLKNTISINLSYPFLQSEFYWFMEKIEEYKIPTNKLIIELVERGDILSLPAIKEKLKLLRSRGIRIFIDDYGSKYSNYNLLKELEVDGIKIDGAAIEHLKEDPLDEIFVNSVISLAKFKNIYIVAEYIETKDHLRKLQKLSEKNRFPLIYGQGYLWGKPVIVE